MLQVLRWIVAGLIIDVIIEQLVIALFILKGGRAVALPALLLRGQAILIELVQFKRLAVLHPHILARRQAIQIED